MSNVIPLATAHARLLDTYDELEVEAGRVGWPKSFKTDLTEHDKARLHGDDAPPVFGWVLRELGTLLLDPRMSRTNLEGYAAHLASADCDSHRFYWHDGRELKEVDRERLVELLREHNAPTKNREHDRY